MIHHTDEGHEKTTGSLAQDVGGGVEGEHGHGNDDERAEGKERSDGEGELCSQHHARDCCLEATSLFLLFLPAFDLVIRLGHAVERTA